MTHPFSYRSTTSLADATAQLAETGTVPMGGGTDLLTLIEERLVQPEAVVDLRSIDGFDRVEDLPDGGLRIGAGARIDSLATNETIAAQFPALSQACTVVATPALRNMGTLGGNLCQRPRCWYFRRGISCHKNGGDSCPARDGENQYLAIIDGGPCYIVHPSDPAVALTALGARVVIAGRAPRSIDIEEFFVLPRDRMDSENVLQPGEIVAAIEIPAAARGGIQCYEKLMQRAAWDFALVSIAAAKRQDGSVRIALGGVAPRPWRIGLSIEEDVASGGLDADSIDALAERALYDAEPLSKNGYKVDQAGALIRRAIRTLVAS